MGAAPFLTLSCSRNRAWNPPTSSSLAEERTPLLTPPQHGGARFSDARSLTLSCSRNVCCSLRSRGSRFAAAAFLSSSQTNSVSARSFVQDSGARSCARGIRLPSLPARQLREILNEEPVVLQLVNIRQRRRPLCGCPAARRIRAGVYPGLTRIRLCGAKPWS
jgi:hypothetical protein